MLSRLFPEELFTLVGRRHLDDQFPHKPFAPPGSPAFTEVLSCRTVYYTAPVAATPSRIEREVMALSATLSYVIEAAEQASRGKDDFLLAYRLPKRTELVIVDEAQRLKMAGLEQLRDLYDRGKFGLVLIGQPGLEKSLARYLQLYSSWGLRISFTCFQRKKPDGCSNSAGVTWACISAWMILRIRRLWLLSCGLPEATFVSLIVC